MFRVVTGKLISRHPSGANRLHLDPRKLPLLLGQIFAALALGLCFLSDPLLAQTSVSVTIQSDDRFRGRSASEGEPVAIVSASYDDISGFFIGGAAAITTNGDDFGFLRASAHAGYAVSLDRSLALDGGVVFTTYGNRYSSGVSQSFVEIFGGVSWGDVAFHANYSPSYLDQNLQTVYLQFDVVRELAPGLRANAKAGLLARVGGEGSLRGTNTRHDFQLSLTKEFDHFDAFVSVTTGGTGTGDYFAGVWQNRTSLTVGISRSF